MFYLQHTNSAGCETLWCSDDDWHGRNHCAFPQSFRAGRVPSIKTWRTRKGVERWLDERPLMRDNTSITIVAN